MVGGVGAQPGVLFAVVPEGEVYDWGAGVKDEAGMVASGPGQLHLGAKVRLARPPRPVVPVALGVALGAVGVAGGVEKELADGRRGGRVEDGAGGAGVAVDVGD